MRVRLVIFSALLVLARTREVSASQLAGTSTGTIEGVVFGANQNPVENASLFLSGVPRGPVYTTRSDGQGRFVFEDIAPGTYSLSAERTGYLSPNAVVRSNGATTVIRLMPGQYLKEQVLALKPQAMIYGKVTTEDGEPVPRADVQVLRQSFRDGRKEMLPVAWINTQDDGGFAIGNLEVGTYYVRATPNRPAAADRRVRPDRKKVQEEYIATFWPNAIDGSAAVSIVLATGAEVHGVEIRLRKSPVFRIRGNVIAPGTGSVPAPRATLSLRPADTTVSPVGSMNVTMANNSDGEFGFENILPGTYILQASSDSRTSTPSMKRLFGRRILTVGNEDIEDVVIQLGEPAQITGKVIIEGRIAWTAPVQVLLIPVDGGHNTSSIPVRIDGTFQLPGIVPDVYRVKVAGLPEKAYLKSVRFTGQGPTRSLDLTTGGGQIEILVSSEAAEVSGIVRNGKGEAAFGAVVQIWNDENIVRSVTASQDGSFHILGLAPGDYSLLAWEQVVPDLSLDPSFRRRLQRWTTLVSLREASRTSVMMIGVAREVIAAEAAQ